MGKGNIIGNLNLPTSIAANGIWGSREQEQTRRSNNWPIRHMSSTNKFKTTTRSPLDITAWSGTTGHNACTVTRDTTVTDSPYGGVPLKMAVTGLDPHIGTYNAATWNISPAVAGETWEVRVLAKASVATTGQIFIFGANSSGFWSGVGAGGTNLSIDALTINIDTSWNEFKFTLTMVSPEIAYVQSRIDGPDSGGVGVNIWLDGMQVYKISA